MEFRLSSQNTEYESYMTEPEFFTAMDQFFFINDDRKTLVCYRVALAHSQWDGFEDVVPIVKLAHIGAYFCLIQIVSELKENINTLVSTMRKEVLENEKKIGSVPSKSNQIVEWRDEFLKLSEIEAIAFGLKFVFLFTLFLFNIY
jgi:hypothetical protein